MDTLFGDGKYVINSLLSQYSLLVSKEFIACADKQLTPQFIALTGLKFGKNLCLTAGSYMIGLPVYEECFSKSNEWGASYLTGGKLNLQLYVNENWNPLIILWKSKKGKDYRLHDTDIDCNDIVFWFDRLEPELYLKQLYPNDKLPYKLKDLSFELVVTRINLDCTLNIQLKREKVGEADAIMQQLHQFIADYNTKSQKKDYKDGVIHNSNSKINDGGNIIFEMDLGSVGASFFKKLFTFMSGMDCFERVEME